MIITVEENQGVYKYTATAAVYYIDYTDSDNWRLSTLEEATINSPRQLYIQTTFTTQGRIDLITFIEEL